jgi:hypothetical protein
MFVKTYLKRHLETEKHRRKMKALNETKEQFKWYSPETIRRHHAHIMTGEISLDQIDEKINKYKELSQLVADKNYSYKTMQDVGDKREYWISARDAVKTKMRYGLSLKLIQYNSSWRNYA